MTFSPPSPKLNRIEQIEKSRRLREAAKQEDISTPTVSVLVRSVVCLSGVALLALGALGVGS